jgi:hemolysin-activating ACP:hemolysin acyltransferase
MSNLTEPQAAALRLFRHTNPAAALGMAVSHLMTKPAFATLPFGLWSKVLVGQINRGTYALVLNSAGRTVGFLGWAITNETAAEAWLAGSTAHGQELTDGDCIIVNAWSADTPEVNHLLLTAAGAGYRRIYFKRHYADGRMRNTRLTMPAVTQSCPTTEIQRKIA